GYLELCGIAFSPLANTQTIFAATFTVFYVDELAGQPATVLSTGVQSSGQTIDLTVPGASQPGSFIEVDSEIMRVDGVLSGGLTYQVTRAMHGTSAVAHSAQATVYPLNQKVVIASFPPDFFGSPASGSWGMPVLLSDARVT